MSAVSRPKTIFENTSNLIGRKNSCEYCTSREHYPQSFLSVIVDFFYWSQAYDYVITFGDEVNIEAALSQYDVEKLKHLLQPRSD